MNEITFETKAQLLAEIRKPGPVFVTTTILGGSDWMEVQVNKSDLISQISDRDYPIFSKATRYDNGNGLFLDA